MLKTLSHRPETNGIRPLSEEEEARMNLASMSASATAISGKNLLVTKQCQLHCDFSPLTDSGDSINCNMTEKNEDDDEETKSVISVPVIKANSIYSGTFLDTPECKEKSISAIDSSKEHLFRKPTPIDQKMEYQSKLDTLWQSSTLNGLRNLGNTCYLNSAVQMLFSLENGFVQDLFSTTDSTDKKRKAQIRDAMIDIARKMRTSKVKIVDPSSLKSAIDSKVHHFVGNRQHDSHEFLSTLLDLLHEELKVNFNDENNTDETNGNGKKLIKRRRKKRGWRHFIPFSGKRTFSYSQLDSDAISDLLHGSNSPEKENNSTESERIEEASLADSTEAKSSSKTWSSITASPSCEKQYNPSLIGGRAAVPVNGSNLSMVVDRDVENTIASSPILVEKEDLNVSQEDEEKHPRKDVDISEKESTECDKKRECSIVDSHFCSQVRVTLTCDSCSFARSKTEMYRYLSIEVASDSFSSSSTKCSAANVEEGLRRFFAPEKRKLKCEKCFFESATQTMKLTKIPNALLLHLKRFVVEWDSTAGRISYSKNQSPVEYGRNLNLSEYCVLDVSQPKNHSNINVDTMKFIPDCKGSDDEVDDSAESYCTTESVDNTATYKLKSVVHHIGSSTTCGHYTADILSRKCEKGRSDDFKWLRCNDSHISAHETNDVTKIQESMKTAYMVMYELEY